MPALWRVDADTCRRNDRSRTGHVADTSTQVPRMGLPGVRPFRGRGTGGNRRRIAVARAQRAPSVNRSSFRTASSTSSRFSAVSHSSHSTSSTAGRPSSDTSTLESSRCTTCICSVFTRKFWSFPQLGQVSATRVSSFVVNTSLQILILWDGSHGRNTKTSKTGQSRQKFGRIHCIYDACLNGDIGKERCGSPAIQVGLCLMLRSATARLVFQNNDPVLATHQAVDRAVHDQPIHVERKR